MLSRLLPKSSHIRLISNLYSKSPSISVHPHTHRSSFLFRPFSSNHGNGRNGDEQSGSSLWKLSGETDDPFAQHFNDGVSGISDTQATEEGSWLEEEGGDKGSRRFDGVEKEYRARGAGRGDTQANKGGSWSVEEGGDEGSHIFDGVEKEYEARGAGRGDTQANEGSWSVEEGGDEGGHIFDRVEKEYRARGAGRGDTQANEGSWSVEDGGDEGSHLFEGVEKEYEARGAGPGDNEWIKSEEDTAWNFEEGEEDKDQKVFDIGDVSSSHIWSERESKSEEQKMLEIEEKGLKAILEGSNRAFGDLIAASGITDDMLDSLIALKDFEGVDGLPPLSQIEDMRYEKNTRKSARAEIERQKQEEVAKARVRQVDEKGRAYGTGRRKCSIARVWIQPGEGKFTVNDKQFDVYFPMLDHRAALLRPFSETKTLGLWDIDCTVKGGGVSGQVGAIQLGISRALQNWEPDLRPPLKSSGFLTRDPRVVERKKPGKAKARKSFQWVKR